MKPKKYILDYNAVPCGNSEYFMTVTFVLDTGNIIRNIQEKHIQHITCDFDKYDKLATKYRQSRKDLMAHLENELKRIGATDYNILTTVKKLMGR